MSVKYDRYENGDEHTKYDAQGKYGLKYITNSENEVICNQTVY